MQATQLQQDIINKATKDKGNILISAAPGSGKTTTLKLVSDAILLRDPKAQILALSYTNSIKEALIEKLDSRCHIFSMHQIGLSFLKLSGFNSKWKFAEHLHSKKGSPDNKYRQILVDRISKDFNISVDGKYIFGLTNECLELLNKGRLELINFDNYDELVMIADKYRLEINGVHHNYIKEAIKTGLLQYQSFGWNDFIDMLWLPIYYDIQAKPGMFIGNKDKNFIANRIDWIICDEFQDASPIIHQVIERFTKVFNPRLLFVGDERQSCFAFAAADTASMQKAKTRFNCQELPLNESFRCPRLVVDFINDTFGTEIISKRNSNGVITTLESSEVFKFVEPGAMVLARTNAQLMQMFLQLMQNDVPARLINFNLKEFFEDLFAKVEKSNPRIWENMSDGLSAYFIEQSNKIRLKYSLYRSNMLIEELRENIDVLNVYVSFIKPKDKVDFFRHLDLLLSNDNKRNYVSLLNIHIAKGLESENVFILDYDKFPYRRDGMDDEAKRQEDNIYFIALSRTLENLYLVKSQPK